MQLSSQAARWESSTRELVRREKEEIEVRMCWFCIFLKSGLEMRKMHAKWCDVRWGPLVLKTHIHGVGPGFVFNNHFYWPEFDYFWWFMEVKESLVSTRPWMLTFSQGRTHTHTYKQPPFCVYDITTFSVVFYLWFFFYLWKHHQLWSWPHPIISCKCVDDFGGWNWIIISGRL